jgi:hypothetical protein
MEEKIIERAEMKLQLDALVIQQGRLVDTNKGLTSLLAFFPLFPLSPPPSLTFSYSLLSSPLISPSFLLFLLSLSSSSTFY